MEAEHDPSRNYPSTLNSLRIVLLGRSAEQKPKAPTKVEPWKIPPVTLGGNDSLDRRRDKFQRDNPNPVDLALVPALERAANIYDKQRENNSSIVGSGITTGLYSFFSIIGAVDVYEAIQGTRVQSGEAVKNRWSEGLIGFGSSILSLALPFLPAKPNYVTIKLPGETDLAAARRLNLPDAGLGTKKTRPGQAGTASQLESHLGKMEPHRVPEKGDFLIIEGPNKGKSVDLMFTADNTKQVEMMNKYFDKNWPIIQETLKTHLNKADFVSLDLRNLNAESKMKVIEYLKTLPSELQSKAIVLE